MTSTPAARCRAFEAEILGRAEGSPLPSPESDHLVECRACRELVGVLSGVEELLLSLAVPPPPPDLADRLASLAGASGERERALEVLALLEPGVLAAPPVPPGLSDRLARIGARDRKAVSAPPARKERLASERPSALRALFGDWRFAVALAYAATLVLVTILGIDPLSAARNTAQGLTAAGERAIAEARGAAAERLEGVLASDRQKPLTEQLDYRLYRGVALARAKTAAYAEILMDRLFGSTAPADETTARPAARPAPPPEPRGGSLRS